MSDRPHTVWPERLVRWGRRRTHVAITVGSVLASVAIVALFFVWFGGTRSELALYFVPAVVVPLIVAPIAVARVLDLAFDLADARASVTARTQEIEALLLAAPIGLAEVAPDGTIRQSNVAARLLLGDERPASAWAARLVHEAERSALLATIGAGRPLSAVRHQWRDDRGASRTVEVHVAPIGGGEQARGVILVLLDVTARDAADAALARAQQLELVGRLAGGMAHDFNNLLTVIRANAAALRGASSPPAVQAIDDAAESGARLTRRLLAISGRSMHAPETQSIGPIIAETLSLAERLLPQGVRMERPGPMPDVRVTVDRDAMQQALLNLLVNARDAVEGSGTVRMLVDTRQEEGRSWLVLTVHDDGPGMAPDVLARATEPFFTTKASHAGTGLGLPMVRDTMLRHGGRLALESRPGAGTAAALWLPDPVAEPPRAAPAAVASSAATPVLLVDDEALVRQATASVLKHLGYLVTSASGAAEARALLATTPCAVIISDVMMPGETGLDLVRSLRDAGDDRPVLLVSGYSPEAVQAVVASDERTAFLAKPWSIDDLQHKLVALLHDRSVHS